MKRFFKWIAIVLAVAVIGITAWGYAPDTDAAAMKAKYANTSSRFIPLKDGTIVHVRDEGPRGAPAIVLIHGSNSALQTWDGWVRPLIQTYRVIRLDLQGHGLTGASKRRDYSQAGFVETVDTVTHALGAETFILGGNSMGGGVSWAYALAHPERVTGLILVDASGAPLRKQNKPAFVFQLAQSPLIRPLMLYILPRSLVKSGMKSSVANPDKVKDANVDLYWELLRYPGNRQATIDRQAAGYSAPATPEQMATITVPTLIMWGAKDASIPLSSGQWFKTHIKGAELVSYPDLGHLPMEEDATRTVTDLTSWLSKASIGASS